MFSASCFARFDKQRPVGKDVDAQPQATLLPAGPDPCLNL